MAGPVDSQDYRFAFEIASLRELPFGFVAAEPVDGLMGGLFLPKDAPGWFGLSTPPRLLLMTGSSLTILSHSRTAAPPVTVPLEEITVVESGHALLIGWIRFSYANSSITFPYNTRSRLPVERFLRRLRALVFPAAAVGQLEAAFGAPLDIKYTNARATELGAEESVAASFFEPATELPRRYGWLSFRHWSPADFLVPTDRRLLWMTDRVKNRFDRYSILSRYVRRTAIRGVRFESAGSEIVFSFPRCPDWRIPVQEEYTAAAIAFAGATERLLGR